MDTDEHKRKSDAPKRKKDIEGGFGDGLAVGLSGAAAVMAGLHLGIDAYRDPLLDAVNQNKLQNIQPDRLAADIAKDPTLQARWRELREFVRKIDQQVEANIGQDAKNVSHTAEHWQERVNPPNLDTSHRPAR